MSHVPAIPGFDDGAVFRSLFAAYPDALLLVDLQGTIVLANPTASALLGYPLEELVGRSVDDLVPDVIRPQHAAYRNAYAKSPRSRPMGTQMELVARRRDGSEVMVEIALSPLQDQGLPYVVAAIRGIGDYPRVKRALQRARYAEFLAQFGRAAVDARDRQPLLDLAPSLAAEALQIEMAKIVLLEPGGASFRILAGVGLLPAESVGGLMAREPDSPLDHVVRDGQSLVVADLAHETSLHIPQQYLDAGMVCEISVPLSDRGRTIGAMAVRSRTPQRFGDDERRFLESLSSLLATVLQRSSSEEALGHAQRLKTVGQLTGGVAHDFNNLLMVISGNLQVLQDAPACARDPFVQQLVGAAARATRRGAELTGKLLAFSRRQVLAPTVVDVPILMRSLTEMLRRTVDQRIAIDLDTQPAHCMADPIQLETALLNVAINARDAMPQGGKLRLTVRATDFLPPDVEVDDQEPAPPHGYVAISISDNGSGMSDDIRRRAFEPFFTTKEPGRGTGLGLSTAYGFVRQSKGAIDLRSKVGAGSLVTLYLPRVQPEAESKPDASGTEAQASAGAEIATGASRVPARLRVLLVEDDADVRSVTEKLLASLGCEIVACGSAEQALEMIKTGPAPALLLSDIALGTGMQGTELADTMRRMLPRLPILLMSGYSSDLLGERPANGYMLLPKPYSRAELEASIEKVLKTP